MNGEVSTPDRAFTIVAIELSARILDPGILS
jgi:hypothetical protein